MWSLVKGQAISFCFLSGYHFLRPNILVFWSGPGNAVGFRRECNLAGLGSNGLNYSPCSPFLIAAAPIYGNDKEMCNFSPLRNCHPHWLRPKSVCVVRRGLPVICSYSTSTPSSSASYSTRWLVILRAALEPDQANIGWIDRIRSVLYVFMCSDLGSGATCRFAQTNRSHQKIRPYYIPPARFTC